MYTINIHYLQYYTINDSLKRHLLRVIFFNAETSYVNSIFSLFFLLHLKQSIIDRAWVSVTYS